MILRMMFLLGLTSSAAFAVSGPLGSQPLQISLGSSGVTLKHKDGFTCDLKASAGGGSYSEWGQTENDARGIVFQKCSNKSGILLCSKDKIVCKKSE